MERCGSGNPRRGTRIKTAALACSFGGGQLAKPLDDPRSIAPTIWRHERRPVTDTGSTPEQVFQGSLALASQTWTSGDAVGRTRWESTAGTLGSSPGMNTPPASNGPPSLEGCLFRRLAGFTAGTYTISPGLPDEHGRRTVELVAWRTAGSTFQTTDRATGRTTVHGYPITTDDSSEVGQLGYLREENLRCLSPPGGGIRSVVEGMARQLDHVPGNPAFGWVR